MPWASGRELTSLSYRLTDRDQSLTDTSRFSLPMFTADATQARARIAVERYLRIQVSLEAILAHSTQVPLNTYYLSIPPCVYDLASDNRRIDSDLADSLLRNSQRIFRQDDYVGKLAHFDRPEPIVSMNRLRW